MAKATIDNRRRKSALTWLWPSSMLVHVVLLLLLMWAGVLTFDIRFNRKEVQQEAAQKSKVGRAREARRKQSREKRQLSKKHQDQLKREIDRKPTQTLKRYVERLAKTRREMQQVKKARLKKIHQRTLEQYRQEMIRRLEQQAAIVQKFSKDHFDWHKDEPHHQKALDAANEAMKLAKQLRDSPNDKQLATEMKKLASKLLEHSRQAMRKELKLGADADVDSKTMPRSAKQLAQTAAALRHPPSQAVLNDTSKAQWEGNEEFSPKQISGLDQRTPAELHHLAKGLAQETAAHYQDARAAEFAMDQNISFNKAHGALATGKAHRSADLSDKLSPPHPATLGDMNQYREALQQALRQAKSADNRSAFLLAQARGLESGHPSAFVAAAMNGRPGSGGGGGVGGGGVGLFDHVQQAGGRRMPPSSRRSSVQVDNKRVLAQALPGRRFAKDTPRKGWLYVNTWYIIGPWENHGAIEYTQTHPPEYEVDFDAEYLDGKKGTYPTSTKQGITLDGMLRWRFTQSDSIRILPYVQSPDSTFYAYTELYFDEATDMVFGIPSDDCTRVWINKQLVWEEFGQSGWGLSESFCRVRFEQGVNTVLVRLENGPHKTQFSFFICPQEAIRTRTP